MLGDVRDLGLSLGVLVDVRDVGGVVWDVWERLCGYGIESNMRGSDMLGSFIWGHIRADLTPNENPWMRHGEICIHIVFRLSGHRFRLSFSLSFCLSVRQSFSIPFHRPFIRNSHNRQPGERRSQLCLTRNRNCVRPVI